MPNDQDQQPDPVEKSLGDKEATVRIEESAGLSDSEIQAMQEKNSI